VTLALGRSGIALIIIVIGALVAVSSGLDLMSAVTAARWPTAPGSISASVIRNDTVGYTSGRLSTRRLLVPRLHVTYTYVVAGQRYTNSQYSVLTTAVGVATLQTLRKYPVGDTVRVHYDPENRSTAVLDASIPGGRVVQAMLGLVVALTTWATTRPRRGNT
jgi:uncharacterized protein DUF3592